VNEPEPKITAFVCAPRCLDGGEHDDKAYVALYGEHGEVCGGSVACSKCGSSAFERSLLELP